MSNDEKITIIPSSSNAFADPGLADAEDLLAKANLALRIRQVIKARGLMHGQDANLLGIDQPEVSSIRNVGSTVFPPLACCGSFKTLAVTCKFPYRHHTPASVATSCFAEEPRTPGQATSGLELCGTA